MKIIAYDQESIFSVVDEEHMRREFIAAPSMLTVMHQNTLIFNNYVEDRVKFGINDLDQEYVDGLAAGAQYLTDVMIDAFGFEATCAEQKRVGDYYRFISRPTLVAKGFLPVEVLAETKGGAHDDVH